MTNLLELLVNEVEWRQEWGNYCVATRPSTAGRAMAWFGDMKPVRENGGWNRVGAVEAYLSVAPDDRASAIITREMWQAERERLSAPERDGEGLPPVGSRVDVVGEVQYGAGEVNCEVVAHVETCAVIRMTYGLGCFTADVLRPAKSQRDKWIESAMKYANNDEDAWLGALYDAMKSGNLAVPEVDI